MLAVMRVAMVGGNWKMNLERGSAGALAREVCRGVWGLEERLRRRVDVVVYPALVHLTVVREAMEKAWKEWCAERGADGSGGGGWVGGGGGVELGGQDLWTDAKGAFTGEVSAGMLKDCGCGWVLAGHSERRHVVGEGDEMVCRKVRAGLSGGLNVVVCVGERLEERERGETDRVTGRQISAALHGVSAEELDRVVVAYEPVWAIGTGRNALPGDAQKAHVHIRGVIAEMFSRGAAERVRIQYGGSVTAANAAALIGEKDVDGALVGGASLKADEFVAIARKAAEAEQ